MRPYKTITKGVPTVREKFNTKATTTCDIRTDEIIHTLSRMDINMNNILPQEQKVGSFAGFQSLLHRPVMKSKPYYFLTFPKPPKKSVTHEVMMRLLDVVEEKNMPFIQLVGDQPVYTIIVQLRNENKEKFKKIIPILGPFDTQVSFITAINKRFSGSGLSDIIVAADIIADKSVDQAMRGKHYRRIVRALQLTYEALQRRIIKNGIQNGLQLSEQIQNCLEKIRDPFCLTTAELQEYVRDLKENGEFYQFMIEAYQLIIGFNSPMANYWLSFMDMVEILIMNIQSLKLMDWDKFKDSLRLMIPWMQIYDNIHYGKWLVEFWAEMSTLPDETASHMQHIFAQSITGKSYSCLPMDLWIEMTMNKGSKMKAGWKHILKNETMLHTHTRNANYINRIRLSLHKIAILTNRILVTKRIHPRE